MIEEELPSDYYNRENFKLNRPVFDKNMRDIIGYIIAAILVITFLVTLNSVISLIGDVFRRNTIFNDNPLLILYIIAFFAGFSYIAIQVVKICYEFYNRITRQKITPNWWVWCTIILMIFFFCVGMFVIDNLAGNQDLKLFLRDKQSQIVIGGINCTSGYIVILEGNTVHCTVEPNLKNITAVVSFYTSDGTIDDDFSDLSFITPSGVNYVYFQINGIDENNTIRNLTIGNPYHFDTPKEYEDSKKIFSTYLFGLFVLVMFSVPAAVANFKKLSEKK